MIYSPVTSCDQYGDIKKSVHELGGTWFDEIDNRLALKWIQWFFCSLGDKIQTQPDKSNIKWMIWWKIYSIQDIVDLDISISKWSRYQAWLFYKIITLMESTFLFCEKIWSFQVSFKILNSHGFYLNSSNLYDIPTYNQVSQIFFQRVSKFLRDSFLQTPFTSSPARGYNTRTDCKRL